MVTLTDFSGQPPAASAAPSTFTQPGNMWTSLFTHNTLIDKSLLFLHFNSLSLFALQHTRRSTRRVPCVQEATQASEQGRDLGPRWLGNQNANTHPSVSLLSKANRQSSHM